MAVLFGASLSTRASALLWLFVRAASSGRVLSPAALLSCSAVRRVVLRLGFVLGHGPPPVTPVKPMRGGRARL
jgi:hypothetical protein